MSRIVRSAMFHWTYLDAGGAETGESDSFGSREDAEAWMGDAWADLLARGVEEVVLVDQRRRLYRMGLREA